METPAIDLDAVILAVRARANERHQEVLRAIDRVADYLRDGRNLDREIAEALIERVSRTSSKPSIRERVLDAIGTESLGIQELVRRTGLTEKQVRGVLYSTPAEKLVNRTRMYGEVRFSRKLGVFQDARQGPTIRPR